MRQFGDDARQQRQAELVQAVRQPVVDHRQHAGIAQQHFVDAARGRVALVGGQHVAVEQAAYAGSAAPKERTATASAWPIDVVDRSPCCKAAL
jgi:hypothetical protein